MLQVMQMHRSGTPCRARRRSCNRFDRACGPRRNGPTLPVARHRTAPTSPMRPARPAHLRACRRHRHATRHRRLPPRIRASALIGAFVTATCANAPCARPYWAHSCKSPSRMCISWPVLCRPDDGRRPAPQSAVRGPPAPTPMRDDTRQHGTVRDDIGRYPRSSDAAHEGGFDIRAGRAG